MTPMLATWDCADFHCQGNVARMHQRRLFFYEEGDSAIGLDWKFVMMGYGCGLVFGFSAGYIMLTIGKPKWLVRMVQRVGYKVLRRLKRYH